jgi:HTH-type transcriptional regulator, cell division transcriptional repressor
LPTEDNRRNGVDFGNNEETTMYSNAPIFAGNDDGDTLGGRICRAREAMGLSAAEVANQLGVRKDTVIAWERDRSEPRTNRLYMLAGVLGVSPVWLISGAGNGGTIPEGDAADKPSTATLLASLSEVRRLHAQSSRAIELLEQEIRSASPGA